MARLLGVDLPANKRVEYALTSIYGIGLTTSRLLLKQASVEVSKKSDQLSEEDIAKLRNTIEKSGLKVEGDLRREISQNIKRLVDLGTYRGLRHRRGLPARGQRTHSNARTRKGKRIAIAGKKSVKAMK
jgi:small subunit ribosomal protein S13